jgi:hypothetical protein|tara:strand:- start:589 stop:720 length:132 start_codon:yes stop_codon:yes gene_type:complete
LSFVAQEVQALMQALEQTTVVLAGAVEDMQENCSTLVVILLRL